MSHSIPKLSKVFTVESANASLPLVRAITADLVHLSRDLLDRKHRWEMLTRGREILAGDLYAEELGQVRQDLARDAQQLQDFERELADLGVVAQSATEGLIDFPALMDGRLVYLCWKYDEPEVLYWHDCDAGFAGRQPLTADSLAGHPHDQPDSEENLFGHSS